MASDHESSAPRAPAPEQLAREVLDGLAEGCQVIGFDWTYLYVNDVVAAQARRPREELIGRTMMECFPGIDATPMFSTLRRCMTARSYERMENEFEFPDGSRGWFELHFAPMPAGACILSRDITDRERIQRQLLAKEAVEIVNKDLERRVAERTAELSRAKEALEAANRELESFSYSVAHDLRAPLRSIDGFSQALVEDFGDKLDGNGRRYLGFVRESAQRMAHLIDDLLALSRVTRTELAREPVDLSALARAAQARLERSEPRGGVEVVIAPGLTAEGDARLLAIVIDNLLGNAWKFTGKREGARIELGAAPGDGLPVYFVRDNGAGFDMAYAGKLFGVFQRLHAAREFEGTGVGLATVEHIVRRHGGRVWAEGEVGVGATFYFTLSGEGRPAD